MIKAPISASEGLFGGACLAVKGLDCVCFYDWNEGAFICKIDVAPSAVISERNKSSISLSMIFEICYRQFTGMKLKSSSSLFVTTRPLYLNIKKTLLMLQYLRVPFPLR